LLFDERNISNFTKAKRLVQSIRKSAESAEKWLLIITEISEETLADTHEDILFFFNSLFEWTASTSDDIFDPERVNRETVNRMRQEMYRHLEVYVPVISLLKDNIHIAETTNDPKVIEFFKLCFGFLTAFVKNNEANQNLIAQYMVVFLNHMHTNLGQTKLIVEIFRDNETLCKEKIRDVIDDIVRLI